MIRSTLDEALRQSATVMPDRTAVRTSGRELSYKDLEHAAGAFAAGLRAVGVQRGDRVAIALPNGVEAATAIYGTLRAGAVVVPLNPSIKAGKLARVLADCEAEALVCQDALAGTAHTAMAAVPGLRLVLDMRPGDAPAEAITLAGLLEHEPLEGAHATEADLAALIYTSGSTGAPKGVMLTHRNMTFSATAIVAYLGLSAADRVLSVLPLSFDYGLYQLLLCVQAGATVLLEPGVGFPGRLVTLMAEQQVTGFPGVPTLFGLMLALPGFAERDWGHVRFLTNTGAAISAKTIRALCATFSRARFYSMYGLTECKRVSYLPPEQLDRRPESVGVPIPGTEAWVESDDGRRCPPGEVGQLMVRGPHVMQGYWRDPAATNERLRAGRWPWEHVLATGDLFRCDEAGFLYFAGRRDDMIKSRGEKVSPREVEEVLLAAPGVLEAAVVGIEDELLGQAVCAHVAPYPGHVLDPQILRRQCAVELEDHLVPAKIIVHAQLPKNPNGKIDRRTLQQTGEERR
jgi:long-chain acyl-CoA synthetase